ncbi:response regulator transcription factor [uncultured Sphingobacterium sp.]|uniref:helix-turn-helix transcriptional regulator n=1 Tax=uncultured Sphingobacterium sp. TaxID=182688 RepID=UPI0025DC60AB|nr:response regulator transcription factor [uncultured Sphingobacterium sp.]
MKKLKIAVILDDEKLFANSFSLLLEKYNMFDYVHVFTKYSEMMAYLMEDERNNIHFFLDYFLGNDNGVTVLQDIKRLVKHSSFIFLSSTSSPHIINNMLQVRPHGIISKSCEISTLVACLKSIELKEFYMEDSLKNIIQNNAGISLVFSKRELQLLHLFMNGSSIAQAAEKACLSTHTIITYRRKMMAKTNCNSILQLLKIAKDHGILT